MKTITACVTNKCNLRCTIARDGYNCVAGCASPLADRKTEVSFFEMVLWLNRFFPSASVHVSGGEPILHGHIRYGLELLLDNGYSVTMFSNGTVLADYPWIYDLPLKWHVTHHRASTSLPMFLRNIDRIDPDRMIVNSVLLSEPTDEIREQYKGYKFFPSLANGTYFDFNDGGDSIRPNDGIGLIGIDGAVHNCSNPKYKIGDIYEMTYDTDAAGAWECHACRYPKRCQAQLTARLMETIE